MLIYVFTSKLLQDYAQFSVQILYLNQKNIGGLTMSTKLDPQSQKILKAIGDCMRDLRKLNSPLDYKSFASNEVIVGMNTYLRMEKGNGDYNISSLLKVINYYPDLKLSEFFKEAGL